MGLSSVLEHRRLHPLTPYKFSVWNDALHKYNLSSKYPTLSESLRLGFHLKLLQLLRTQCPPNSPSLVIFRHTFDSILERELSTSRYVGPFTPDELFELLGPFQTSPISIIPKSGKPGKFRVIQNFSFPLVPSLAYPCHSVNSSVCSDDFPCTWGTFNTVCTIIRSLPPGSRAATRDVAEAYRTMPLHPSQWPAAVVLLPDGKLCVDTCVSFGMGPSAGVYGHVADASIDLLRAVGIGPITKWVNDHLFFRIWCEHIIHYDAQRQSLWSLLGRTGPTHSGGHIWYKGMTFPDGSFNVHAEDYLFPL